MRICILLVALIMSFFRAGLSHAGTADTNPMQVFMQSDRYKGVIANALASLPPDVFQRCPTLISNGSTITVLRPMSFDSHGFPDSGLWKQSFPVSGCGNDTILNLYFAAAANGKIDTVIGVPGTTHADLTLQRDTFRYATTHSAVVAIGCTAFVVKNSRFDGYDASRPLALNSNPEGRYPAWKETWTLTGCGRTLDVPIIFIPDANGTRIIVPDR